MTDQTVYEMERSLGLLGERSREASRALARCRSEQRLAAREAHAAGVDVTTIARLLGVTRVTVYAWLRDG